MFLSGDKPRAEPFMPSLKASEPKPSTTGGSTTQTNYPPELLKKFYSDMLLIRRFEEKAGQLYGMGLIGGFCHLYIGQEAVATAITACQQPQDTVVTSYRDHAHMLVLGMSADGVMAELTGREGGYSRGKGGSMHMFSREKGFFGGHGIVGAQVPIGTGLAFAHKYKNDNGICVTYMGDGAVNQGQVYESFNIAALQKLPVLYIIENNKYSMGTSQKRHAAGELCDRGTPYGIPGKKVDGQDVLAVYAAAQEAIAHVRSGNGPMVLEMETYRYRGHSMSDPAKYRTKEEVDQFKSDHDPIETLKAYMQKVNAISEDEFKAIEKSIKETVNQSAEFAQNSPEPDVAELWTDVLVES